MSRFASPQPFSKEKRKKGKKNKRESNFKVGAAGIPRRNGINDSLVRGLCVYAVVPREAMSVGRVEAY